MTIIMKPEAIDTCEAYKALQVPTSDTIMTLEVDKLYTSRYINNKLVRLSISLCGTLQDAIVKCDRIANLDNTMYIMLSEIAINSCEAI